jgi:hypothetical protein
MSRCLRLTRRVGSRFFGARELCLPRSESCCQSLARQIFTMRFRGSVALSASLLQLRVKFTILLHLNCYLTSLLFEGALRVLCARKFIPARRLTFGFLPK